MKRIIPIVLILAGVIGLAIAADYTPQSIESVATITGAKTFSGKVLTTGLAGDTPTSTSLTNGAVLTVTAKTHIISGIGGVIGTTNAVTIANPTFVGQELNIIMATSGPNLISLADSGNLKLSAAFVGDNYDVISLKATEAAVWVEIGRTDN